MNGDEGDAATRMTRIHPHLPVFRVGGPRRDVLYVPGHAAVVSRAQADAVATRLAGEADARQGDRPSAAETTAPIAEQLVSRARAAMQAWDERRRAPFAPECLTVYLSNHCNLACVYCYSAAAGGSRRGAPDLPLLEPATVAAAARVVAPHCRARGKPFHLVVHGGGEPTLHFELLQSVVAITREVAAAHGLEWWGYIATNGIMSVERARWLGENFSRIGLSCDGPPDVHEQQRPTVGGVPSTSVLRRNAEVWTQTGTAVAVRATVTPASVHRQADMMMLAHALGAAELVIEPAYTAGRGGERPFLASDAEGFVRGFAAAQALGEDLGLPVRISGVRLDEIHGPHCNVLRDVLHLTPDGAATACFLCTDSRQPPDSESAIGAIDAVGFDLDGDRIAAIRARAMRIPPRCEQCVNVLHCARDCPEVCPVTDAEASVASAGGFRCRVQQELGLRWIRRLAESEVVDAPPDADAVVDVSSLATFAGHAPPEAAVDHIVRDWQRVRAFARGAHSMPRPPWADRGFADDEAGAWQQLRAQLARDQSASPMAVYVHVPFCDRKCSFCDCYTMRVRGDARVRVERHYVAALVADIEAWSRCGSLSRRPVTTVHFGGGTPSYLAAPTMATVVDTLRRRLAVDADTEWALESTSSQLDADGLDRLQALGFRRLHIGVQTLNDSLRTMLGRLEPAAAVTDKIAMAAARGFIVSVDLVYGLPGQGVADFAADLARLDALPIDGVSLYQLNSTTRNRTFARRYGTADRNQASDFALFALGDQLLRERGFRKNHFAHYARGADANLYYTHAARGEDLLAVGTTADGIFGDYRYRHPEYREYVQARTGDAPRLQGGGRDTPGETRLRRVSAALMTSVVARADLEALAPRHLLDAWLDGGLLVAGTDGSLELTAAGAWCLRDMLDAMLLTLTP